MTGSWVFRTQACAKSPESALFSTKIIHNMMYNKTSRYGNRLAGRGAELPLQRPREDARMDNDTITITDNRTKQSYTIPIYRGTIRAMDLRQIKTGPDDFGLMTYDPAFMNTASCQSAITYPGWRCGHPALPWISHRTACRTLQLPGSGLPAAQRRAADDGRTGDLEPGSHGPHPDPRKREEVHGWLPLRRASHGDPDQHGGGAVDVLFRVQATSTIRRSGGGRWYG